jgi:molybdopterin-guanine dinucleotide biosynthesis protein A
VTTGAPVGVALAGVFVGGRARRMGGKPKGLLRGPEGRTLVDRWSALLADLGVPLVLVGEARAYAAMDIPALADDPPGIGPLGGLVALLRHAEHAGARSALALACDMPFVSRALVERLLAASPDAPAVAPRREGRWEPLCARYDPARILPLAVAQAASPRHSLQSLLDQAGAAELPLLAHEGGELHDWDSPGDVTAHR